MPKLVFPEPCNNCRHHPSFHHGNSTDVQDSRSRAFAGHRHASSTCNDSGTSTAAPVREPHGSITACFHSPLETRYSADLRDSSDQHTHVQQLRHQSRVVPNARSPSGVHEVDEAAARTQVLGLYGLLRHLRGRQGLGGIDGGAVPYSSGGTGALRCYGAHGDIESDRPRGPPIRRRKQGRHPGSLPRMG